MNLGIRQSHVFALIMSIGFIISSAVLTEFFTVHENFLNSLTNQNYGDFCFFQKPTLLFSTVFVFLSIAPLLQLAQIISKGPQTLREDIIYSLLFSLLLLISAISTALSGQIIAHLLKQNFASLDLALNLFLVLLFPVLVISTISFLFGKKLTDNVLTSSIGTYLIAFIAMLWAALLSQNGTPFLDPSSVTTPPLFGLILIIAFCTGFCTKQIIRVLSENTIPKTFKNADPTGSALRAADAPECLVIAMSRNSEDIGISSLTERELLKILEAKAGQDKDKNLIEALCSISTKDSEAKSYYPAEHYTEFQSFHKHSWMQSYRSIWFHLSRLGEAHPTYKARKILIILSETSDEQNELAAKFVRTLNPAIKLTLPDKADYSIYLVGTDRSDDAAKLSMHEVDLANIEQDIKMKAPRGLNFNEYSTIAKIVKKAIIETKCEKVCIDITAGTSTFSAAAAIAALDSVAVTTYITTSGDMNYKPDIKAINLRLT